MLDARMEFGFNEERIVNDGEYTVTEIYTLLDETIKREGLMSTSKGIYEGNYDKDYDIFASVIIVLSGLTWFCKYCSMWRYINPVEGIDDVYNNMKECGLCL